MGPKIDVLSIEQNFGTVKFVENSDVTANEIVFRVRNRAADKYFLTRITSLLVSLGQKELLVGKEASELRANVTLASLTSNRLSGDVKCRRADVEVEVPTACLLDETKLVANVTKGHIRSRDLSAANFETVQVSDEGDEGKWRKRIFFPLSLSLSLSLSCSAQPDSKSLHPSPSPRSSCCGGFTRAQSQKMLNKVGDIEANDLHAFKIELNTSTGTITTNNTACHTMRVNTDEDRDGAILKIHNVTLFEGDNKNLCQEAVDYAPGFPQTKEYEVRTLKCETEPGVLVIDSKGAENGGRPAVVLGRIKGGNVKHKIKVGHTRLQVRPSPERERDRESFPRPGSSRR